MAPVESLLNIPREDDLGLYYECLSDLAVTGEDWRRVRSALVARNAVKSGFFLHGHLYEEHVFYESKQEGSINALALSPDGNIAATASSRGVIRLIPLGNIISGRPHEPAYATLPMSIYSLAFTPGGKIVAGTADQNLAFIPIEQILAEERKLNISAVSQSGKVFAISPSPDNKTLLQVGQGFLSLIKTENGIDGNLPSRNSVISFEGTFYAAKFLGPSNFFVAAYENGQLFYGNAKSDKIYVKDFHGYRAMGGCYGLDYHEGTKRLAVVGPGFVDVLQLGVEKDIPVISRIQTRETSDIAHSASFSKSGDKLAVGVDGGGVDVFKIGPGSEIVPMAEYRPQSAEVPIGIESAVGHFPPSPALPPFSPTNSVKFCIHDSAIAAVTEDGVTRIIGDSAIIEAIGAAVIG